MGKLEKAQMLMLNGPLSFMLMLNGPQCILGKSDTSHVEL